MNRDAHSIFETYKTSSANQEIIQEGLFDRLKARGAQAVGAAKGLGQRAIGGAQELSGKYGGKLAGAIGGGEAAQQAAQNIQKAGKTKISAGKMAGDTAKYQSIIKSTVTNTVNDLNKLKIPVKDEAALTQALTDAIMGQLKQVTKSGMLRGPGGRIGSKVS